MTVSACWFAVRVLTDPDIPPSSGAMRPVKVTAPEGCLLNARSPAAVVAGNVETSSRVADLVLKAFGRALGQGTMNNLTLGNDDFTYYETLGGGQGACEDADGPTGVHVAMSNTLNTPVEALELEFPLRVVDLRAAARFRRRGRAPRRRRRDPRGRGAGRDGLLAAHRAPPAPAAGRERWQTGRVRARTCSTARSSPRRRAGRSSRDNDYESRHREAADMAEKVGFIGLGIMGSLQAMNLAKAGVELTVFNRTREKAEAWAAEHGGTVVDSPKAVAEASDVVITMVVDGAQVEDMIGQALEGAKPGHAVHRHVDDRARAPRGSWPSAAARPGTPSSTRP